MRDSLKESNVADFRQRYRDCYGMYLTKNNEQKLVYISGVDEERVRFRDASGVDFFANVNANVEFEFLPLTRGLHNIQDDVVLLSRVPAQQYKRGISDGNTSILSMSRRRNMGVSFDLLEQVFSVKHDVKARYKQWKVDHTPVALSKHFCLVDDAIYFNDVVVGSIRGNPLVAKVNETILQEFNDALRRNDVTDVSVEKA